MNMVLDLGMIAVLRSRKYGSFGRVREKSVSSFTYESRDKNLPR